MSKILENQRALWQQSIALKDRPFITERPAIFGPAAASQDLANGTGTFFRWSPLLIPLEYTDWVDEARSYLDAAYIGDWSGLTKLAIRGPGALDFLKWVGMNSLEKFEVGQAKHHVQLDEQGKVASEGLLCRIGATEYRYTGGGADWTGFVFAQGRWDAEIEIISADEYVFAIQGPASLHVLERATRTSLRDLRFNHSRRVRIAARETRILRSGVSGELGYELHGSVDDANAIWAAVVEAGAAYGLRQLGVRTQILSHIEAGIATVGLDYLPSSIVTPGAPKLSPSGAPRGSYVVERPITDYFRSSGELGWGGRAGSDHHEFLGAAALRAEQATGGPARRLVGLEWDPQDVIAAYSTLFDTDGAALPIRPMELPRLIGLEYDEVQSRGKPVGCSTSRIYSSHVRRMISLGVVDRELTAPGTDLTVVWGNTGQRQHNVRVKVRQLPFKPDRRRTDVTTLPIR